MIDLSIVIPMYNTKDYVVELLSILVQQLDFVQKNVEIIIVDDGSREPFEYYASGVKVIRHETNLGVSAGRNTGIENANGRYIAFIDSDDLVSVDYVAKILEAIEKKPDVIYLSWRTFGKGWEFACDLSKMDFPEWNLCVWNRVWKKEIIGDVRFNTKKAISEDAQFIHQIKFETVAKITKYVYFYRTGQESLTSSFAKGELDFDRVVFHYPTITKDMTDVLEEVKRVNEYGEAIVLTNHNEIEELKQYAMVMNPKPVSGTRLVGEPFSGFHLVTKPIRTQVVIYIGKALKIGGVETWIYNFVSQMHELYDIIVAYTDFMTGEQIARLSEKVQVCKLLNRKIVCDTLLNMRITDKIPEMIKAKKIIQLCHTCQMKDWKIQPDYDKLVYVSDTARQTFKEKGIVIHNMTYSDTKKSLLLVTASRFTFEKGLERMNILASVLKKANIPFLWLVFTDKDVNLSDGMLKVSPTLDIKGYIQKADYLVQLSDQEAFCYSLVEAMELGVPVITTKLDVLDEIGFVDRKTGFALSKDMKDIPVEEIYKGLKKFKYKWDNEKIIAEWVDLLGKSTPTGDYNSQSAFVKVQIIEDYGDLELGRNVKKGEEITMRRDRARLIVMNGKGVIM